MNSNKEDIQSIAYWVHMGAYYGYPDCCVNEFVYRILNREKAPKRKFYGTGYIPCKKCNRKTKAQMLEYITKNRGHKQPFPYDDSDVF